MVDIKDKSKGKHKRGARAKPKDYEIRMIVDKWTDTSDKQMAETLDRPEQFVIDQRHALNLYRSGEDGHKYPTIRTSDQLPPPELDESYQKALKKLERSESFQRTRALLSKDEVEYYENKYIEIISSLGHITPSENDSVHLMVMELIRQLRILTDEKKYRDDPENNTKEDFDGKYDDSIERYRALQKSLKASREQRLKGREGSSITLTSIIQKINSEKVNVLVDKEIEEILNEKKEWQKQSGAQITESE